MRTTGDSDGTVRRKGSALRVIKNYIRTMRPECALIIDGTPADSKKACNRLRLREWYFFFHVPYGTVIVGNQKEHRWEYINLSGEGRDPLNRRQRAYLAGIMRFPGLHWGPGNIRRFYPDPIYGLHHTLPQAMSVIRQVVQEGNTRGPILLTTRYGDPAANPKGHAYYFSEDATYILIDFAPVAARGGQIP